MAAEPIPPPPLLPSCPVLSLWLFFLEADCPPNRHRLAPINPVSLFLLSTMCPGWAVFAGCVIGATQGTNPLPGRHGVRVWSTLTLNTQLFRFYDRLRNIYCLRSFFHVFLSSACYRFFLWILQFNGINMFPTNLSTYKILWTIIFVLLFISLESTKNMEKLWRLLYAKLWKQSAAQQKQWVE